MKVYVVHGAPLSGKTTYVKSHKGDNDIVFDFDMVMAALSGREAHDHIEALVSYVLDIRDMILTRLRRETQIDNAWIISTRASKYIRDALKGLDVEYVQLDIDKETALQRLHSDPKGRDIAKWERIIREYYSDHSGVDKSDTARWIRSLLEKDDLHAFYVSTPWLHLRAEVLEEHKSECQECKKKGLYTKANHVHHVQYVRRYPELALSKTYTYKGKEYNNLIPVCKDCHETVCHPERLRRNKAKPLTEERW